MCEIGVCRAVKRSTYKAPPIIACGDASPLSWGNGTLEETAIYDFDGETTVYMPKAGSGATKFEQDLGGGW